MLAGLMNAVTMDTRIRSYLDAIPGAVSSSGGHPLTLRVATALVIGFALSQDEARPYLDLYNKKCEPPWNDKELEHKLAEADKNKLNLKHGWLIEEDFSKQSYQKKSSPERKLSDQEKIQLWTANIERKLGGWRADPADVWEAS